MLRRFAGAGRFRSVLQSTTMSLYIRYPWDATAAQGPTVHHAQTHSPPGSRHAPGDVRKFTQYYVDAKLIVIYHYNQRQEKVGVRHSSYELIIQDAHTPCRNAWFCTPDPASH